jgi:hypothetical protein
METVVIYEYFGGYRSRLEEIHISSVGKMSTLKHKENGHRGTDFELSYHNFRQIPVSVLDSIVN